MPTEFQYIKDIEQVLINQGIYAQAFPKASGVQPDLVFKSQDGETIAVEVKDAKNYGELPLSTAIQLKNLQHEYNKVILISLSDISENLLNSLDNIGIKHVLKPASPQAAGAALVNMEL